MLVDTVLEDTRWNDVGLADLSEKAAQKVLLYLGLAPESFVIGLLGCNDSRIATLNTEFRGKPGATNVLSWPFEERAAVLAGERPKAPSPGELGDIAISYETCLAEADAQKKATGDHVTHLIVHGVLHLLGYDHENDADATLMESLETSVLAELGISDPYRETDA